MAGAADSSTLLKRPLYVFDLPRELLDSLQTKQQSTAAPNGQQNLDDEIAIRGSTREASAENETQNQSSAASCNVCGLSFPNVQEQRNHVKSDLHGYNLKQRVRGHKAVTEVEFEKLLEDLDESISGSESSGSDSDSHEAQDGSKQKDRGTMLSALLKKQANIAAPEDVDTLAQRKRKRDSGKPPLIWFNSPLLPSNISLGVYRALFTSEDRLESTDPVDIIRQKQVPVATPSKREDDEGGVPLPSTRVAPHFFLCMIGGGHFAAMVVSLEPKISKKQGADERKASVLAHKTFHRYTTRRKQGGSQAANDMAKGTASSAGSALRRYNETALVNDIRTLLAEWKTLIDSSELLFIRQSGSTNRSTLFGPYEGQVLRYDDPRIRNFPFSTRRATQAELMNSFVQLTRMRVSELDEAALAAAQAKAVADAEAEKQKVATATAKQASTAPKVPEQTPEEEAAMLHTGQIEALVRRSKAPALVSYFSTHSLPVDFHFHPPESHAHHHAPTALHLAASSNSPALVSALLLKIGADPGVRNAEGKTAFEIAGDRVTRDAFRLARSELGEERWLWDDAGVPEALSKAEAEKRAAREREDEAAKESSRRAAQMERLRDEEQRKEAEREKNAADRRDKKMGKGAALGERTVTAEERREEETRGMTPEMRARLERERRARAMEERLRKMQGGGGGGGY